jgi:hypothetical protein
MSKPLFDTKADAWTIPFIAINKDKNVIDITGWKFIAEIGDKTLTIKKASSGIIGGDDSQIKIIDAVNGKFEIYVDNDETKDFANKGYLEIAIFVNDRKKTIYSNDINFAIPHIQWTHK